MLRHRGVVGVVDAGVVEAEHGHALDQRHPLAPVVERGERADHAHHGVGQVAVVGGHVGQPLDLADHVVAEVAHHAAVQRRQLGEHRRPVGREEVLERGEDARRRAARRSGSSPSTSTRPSRSTQRGDRVAPDEGEPAPALAVLDRLEQEARRVADELGVGRDRRLEVGEQLGPHRHDRVLAGERAELVPARPQPHSPRPEAAEEARVLAGVAGAVARAARP